MATINDYLQRNKSPAYILRNAAGDRIVLRRRELSVGEACGRNALFAASCGITSTIATTVADSDIMPAVCGNERIGVCP